MGYFIIIPEEVRRDRNLSSSAKILFGDIRAKSEKTGECWATNRCFTEEYGIGATQIKVAIQQLCGRGYIAVNYEGAGNGIRKIVPLISTPSENRLPPSENRPGEVSDPVGKPSATPSENRPQKRRKEKNIFSHASKEWQSAAFLSQQLDSRKQSGKPTTEADKQRWAADFDKCHRLDGHPWEEIGDVLVWCQQDRFWQGNIRSGATFRKHYDRLAESAIRTGGENYAY